MGRSSIQRVIGLTFHRRQLEHRNRTHQFLRGGHQTGRALILCNELFSRLLSELRDFVCGRAQDCGNFGLFGGTGRNRGDQSHQSRGGFMCFTHPFTRAICQVGFFDHLLDGLVYRCDGIVCFHLYVLYQVGDLPGRLARIFRQTLDFLRHHRKSAPRLSRHGRLHCGVQRKHVGAFGNGVDQIDDL